MGVTESVIGWEGAGRGLVCRLGTPDWGPIRGRSNIRQYFGNMGADISCTSCGYSGVNWGQSQPLCTVKTYTPCSLAERADTKDCVREDFCWDRKTLVGLIESQNLHLHALAWVKWPGASCSAGGGHNTALPKGLKFLLLLLTQQSSCKYF